jgi:voltage-gated potassium channel Kch
VDFNPETLERLMARGFRCYYGDISNGETLRHVGVEHAAVVISSISDWMLKGTSNARILREVRILAPTAQIVVAADSVAGAEQLYAQGADYVLISPVLAAEHLYQILGDLTPAAIQQARTHQHRKLLGRLAPT